MNIIFVTQNDPFYIPLFFEKFYNKYKKTLSRKIKISGVIIQDSLGNASKFALFKRVIILYGLFGVFYKIVQYLKIYLSSIFHKVGWSNNLQTIKTIHKENDIPILKYKSVNTKMFKEFVIREGIDLIVSVAASEIFEGDILKAVKYGCINIHSAPLPKYKGMLPNFWQMYNNESRAYITVHKMEAKLDSGDILYQDFFDIDPDWALEELFKKSKEKAAEIIINILESYLNKTV
ncbi:MAG: hypothetical protein KDK36_20970, partial [Leptospiraceae bacterium]|nr:hypothetical protein [Leptospiraceae bacterium]